MVIGDWGLNREYAVAIHSLLSAVQAAAVWAFTRSGSFVGWSVKLFRWGLRTAVTLPILLVAIFASEELTGVHVVPSQNDAWVLIGFPRNAISPVVGFAYLACLADRMERDALRRVCLLMCVLANVMVLWVAEVFDLISMPGTPALFAAEVPLLGPLHACAAFFGDFLHNARVTGADWGDIALRLFAPLWVTCSTVILLRFGWLFMRLAVQRKGDSASLLT